MLQLLGQGFKRKQTHSFTATFHNSCKLTKIYKLTIETRATNCVMHSLCGKDRTAKEWAEVIRLVSPDLELGQIVSPPGRAWSLIEIVRKGSATIYSPIC
jgi:hypothetical protein